MWDSFFPQALPVYEYSEFLKAVMKFPAFCGETKNSGSSLRDACGLELATFLAHVKHESGSLQYVEEIACSQNNSWYCNYS